MQYIIGITGLCAIIKIHWYIQSNYTKSRVRHFLSILFWVADLILHDVLCLEVGFRAADLPTLREYQEYQRMDL